jgi:alanine dehydrogenase
LTAATLPYIRALAAGWTHAVTVHPELIGAVNVQSGEIVHPAIREELAKR